MDETTDSRPATWLVTGCDKGLGRAIAQAALDHGHRVAATVLAADGRSDLADRHPGRCRAWTLDVRDSTQVQRVVAEAEQAFGGIDVLVNNAGYGLVGAAEETTESEYRRLFDVNFFGTVEVTRAVLPGMRRQRRGHVFSLSSLVGFVGYAGFSLYSASKFAVEGFIESLAKEMMPFGLKFTLVEPGGFRTDFAGASLARAALEIDAYAATAGATRQYMQSRHGQQPGDPARLGAALCRVAAAPNPPLRLPLGADALQPFLDKLQATVADAERWRDLSLSTSFPS